METTKVNIGDMDSYSYNDNLFSYEGAVSLQHEKNWTAPWRIDYDRFELYPNLTEDAGRLCAGIRLSFATTAQNIALDLADMGERPIKLNPNRIPTLDVFVDGCKNQQISYELSGGVVYFKPLEEGLKVVEIWLDNCFPFRLKGLYIDKGAHILRVENRKKRWIHYGSSISHLVQAYSPSATWTSIVAQKCNLHLTNLGFRGQCMLDPMVGHMIKELPADYITLKIGINLHEGALSQRTFEPCAIGLIHTIREKHKNTPIFIISPIYCVFRDMEFKKNDCGYTLPEMRSILEGIVEKFARYGDKNIYYVDGLKIFNKEEMEQHSEGLHPFAEGQFILAEHFIENVFDKNLASNIRE
jgi:hypothetical protein